MDQTCCKGVNDKNTHRKENPVRQRPPQTLSRSDDLPCPARLETATRRQLRSYLRGDNYEPDPAETARHATPTAYGNMPALSSSFSALSEGPSSAVAPATVTDVTVGWPLGATPPGLLAPDILGTLKPCLSTTHFPVKRLEVERVSPRCAARVQCVSRSLDAVGGARPREADMYPCTRM